MKFIMKPKRTHPKDTSTLPKTLPTYTLPSPHTPPAIQRYITMYEYQSPTTGNPTHLYINGKRFSDPVTETPRTGSTEVWEVINLTGDNHPLHIHLATFQAVRVQQLMDVLTFTRCMTLKYDAVACNVTAHATGPLVNVPDNEKTWKNIVKIAPGTMTTVVVKFNLVDRDEPYPFDATTGPGYVYHCHILDHEDNEMIRPLKLVR